MKAYWIMPIILLSVIIFSLIGTAYAYVPDSLYKDHTYSVKPSYYDVVNSLENGIKLSESILSELSFENEDAKKKIDTAWKIRWMAWETHGKANTNLKQAELYLQNSQNKNSYDKLLEIEQNSYSLKNDLYAIIKESREALDLEKEYQEKNKFCFLFWCEEIKDYSHVYPKIQNVESQLKEIENKISIVESRKDSITKIIHDYEIDQKNTEIQRLQKIEREKQWEVESKQRELEIKQYEIEQEERLRKQQQKEYEARIEEEKQSTLQILASNNPLLKKIMTGKVTFWAEQVPSYAAPNVANEVNRILDTFESWNGVSRVYNEGSADIRIQWIKEFSPHQGGQYWQSYVQVGLGQTGCYGEWQPFVSHSVRHVLWHEIGHAMGYGHSNDQNNIMMGDGLEKYFLKEYEDDLFLEDGHFSWRPFCRDGQYTFNLKGNSESSGFKFYVITPETDAKKFIVENEGLHYSDCTEKGTWVSYTMTCNVAKGSYLLVYNPRDDGRTINVDVLTSFTGNKRTYNMQWDPDALKESSQYLYYLDSLR